MGLTVFYSFRPNDWTQKLGNAPMGVNGFLIFFWSVVPRQQQPPTKAPKMSVRSVFRLRLPPDQVLQSLPDLFPFIKNRMDLVNDGGDEIQLPRQPMGRLG